MKLTVAKFGGSALGEMGKSIPTVVNSIMDMAADSKVVAVFSAPLTRHDGRRHSLTDVILAQGRNVERHIRPDLSVVRHTYDTILDMVDAKHQDLCRKDIEHHLSMAQDALDEAYDMRRFTLAVRARALGHSGELLTSHVMYHILSREDASVAAVPYDSWPIITDDNLEFTNFLPLESKGHASHMAALLEENDIVCIGGFIGKTTNGQMTTYERGGTDRTAADVAILFHREYETNINWVKDSAVVSADPRVVDAGLTEVKEMSYNETRLAGMFGMSILDSIAIKDIADQGLDIPLRITNVTDPAQTTVIRRQASEDIGHPIKIITGKGNCAIMRIQSILTQHLIESLRKRRQYGEFVLLSPFIRGATEFARILFTDGDFVRSNERYLLDFDPLASITYNRGAITLIGDSMWRVQQVASKTSAPIGEAGINILNMDAQEETSRILIIIEDTGDNMARAVRAIHNERPRISFV